MLKGDDNQEVGDEQTKNTERESTSAAVYPHRGGFISAPSSQTSQQLAKLNAGLLMDAAGMSSIYSVSCCCHYRSLFLRLCA